MTGAIPAAAGSGQATQGSGYLEELLRALGASPATARHVQDLLLRPVTIVIILVVAAIVARLGSSLIKRSLRSIRERAANRADPGPGGEARRDPRRLEAVVARIDTVGRIAANVWRVAVWVIALLSILGVLGINLAPFVAGTTVIGATIGFGAQSLVRDYLSGFLLLAEDQFRIGDDIATASAHGVVEEMTLRVTRLRGDDGTVWYVPNGDIRTLGNTSRISASSWVDVVVPVDAPIPEAARLIAEATAEAVAAPEMAAVCIEPPELLGVEQADSSTLTFRIALHTAPGTGAPVARAIRATVTSRLVAAGIIRPVPTPT